MLSSVAAVMFCKMKKMATLCSGSCRPGPASACSCGPDTSQHVHTSEDNQRQSQPQTAVHGERMSILPNILP